MRNTETLSSLALQMQNIDLRHSQDQNYLSILFGTTDQGPSLYVFLLTALCLTVLDQWQTLITSCVSFSRLESERMGF